MCSSLAYENTGHASKSFRFFLVLAFSLTLGNYTERLIPGNTITGSFLPQQMLAVTAWSSVFASVLLFESGARQRSLHLMLYVFIAYCGLTSLWGNDPKGGVSKAIVLFYTTTIVSVVVSRLGINEVVDGVRRAMMALISVSVVLAVFLPSVGVLDTWNHAGKWNGIFSTKQDLGFCSSFYLIIFAYQIKVKKCSWLEIFSALGAVLCLVMSESRGGMITATVATLAMLGTQRAVWVRWVVGFLPVFVSLLAAIAYVGITKLNNPFIVIGGEEFNVSGRMILWEYAAKRWLENPFFGFGLNQFWTDVRAQDEFERGNGWFLDNFHSGYFTIITETGVFGYFLLILVLVANWLYSRRLSAAMSVYPLVALSFVLVAVISIMNISETYLLRSTSAYQLLLTACLVANHDWNSQSRGKY